MRGNRKHKEQYQMKPNKSLFQWKKYTRWKMILHYFSSDVAIKFTGDKINKGKAMLK